MTLHLKSPKNLWLFLVGVSAGLTFLSKEIGIFALIASIVCLFLIKSFSVKYLVVIISSFLLASSPYWIPILTIQEAHDAALSYWHWQVSRDPNQPDSFYFTILSQEALGYVLGGLFCTFSNLFVKRQKNIKKTSSLYATSLDCYSIYHHPISCCQRIRIYLTINSVYCSVRSIVFV